ncbi:MAG TPA: hypothetical protein VGD42_13845 [Lysobacter sp.]
MTTVVRPPRTRRYALLVGCLLLVLAIGLVLAALVFGVFRYADDKLHGSVPPPGDPRRFDPIASYVDVAHYAGAEAQLTGLRAMFVRRDGTLDLEADYRPAPYVDYRFRREVAAPVDAPPLGAGGSPDGRWHEAIQVEVARPWRMRSVRRTGGEHGGANVQYFSRGMERRVDAPSGRAPDPALLAPACSFRQLWDAAVARGASPDAVAIIEYERDGYTFNIPDARFVLRFDPRCVPRR